MSAGLARWLERNKVTDTAAGARLGKANDSSLSLAIGAGRRLGSSSKVGARFCGSLACPW